MGFEMSADRVAQKQRFYLLRDSCGASLSFEWARRETLDYEGWSGQSPDRR
jgi:hypothetical protein